MADDPLQHMRERIDMCRRLAKSINDQEAAKILREMADQGEIDLKRLLEERNQNQAKGEARKPASLAKLTRLGPCHHWCRIGGDMAATSEAAKILREMADQGEIDLKRLLEERNQNQAKGDAR